MTPSVPGVVVLGMHRSGTSAVAGSLVETGLHPCLPADLLPATPDNASGHWESMAVNAENNAILAAVGHSWRDPPGPGPDWTDVPAVRRREALARRMFEWLHPAEPWVVKDPRLCLTISFWRRVWPVSPAVVLVLRHPEAVARSLTTRDGMAADVALALCDRYTRAALAGATGLPALVVSYEDIVQDPAAWRRQSLEFLHQVGVAADASSETRGDSRVVDPALQHWKSPRPDTATVASFGAWDAAMKLLGAHVRLPAMPS